MRKALFMLILLALLASGCANGNVDSGEQPTGGQTESLAAHRDDDGSNGAAQDTDEADAHVFETATAMQEEETPAVEIPDEPLILLDEVPPLSMEPHEPVSRQNAYVRLQFPLNTPYYGKNYRLQVVRYDDNHVELEIGNTSDEPMVITDDDLHFLLFDGAGQDISKSKLQGSPVTIEPGTKKTVTVTKAPRAIYLNFYDGKESNSFSFPLKQEITDTEPLEEYFMYELLSNGSHHIMGNGKIKFQVKKARLTGNKTVKGIYAGDEGRIILLNLQLANTSDETMKLNRMTAVINDFVNPLIESLPDDADMQKFINENFEAYREADKLISETIEIPLSALEWLGDLAFPAEVPPGTIVEGYVPAIMKDPILVNNLVVETNLGTITFGNITNYSLW
jgi:hypothetical protein